MHLQKGEGIYQPAGLPHAYLEGQNVEVMANSDNVLRAGLTDKHIDVPELMKHVQFEETIPNILSPGPDLKHKQFSTPAEEFELHQFQLKPGDEETVSTRTGEIWLVLEGTVVLGIKDHKTDLMKGDSIFVLPGNEINLRAGKPLNLFRVCVPVNNQGQ